MRRFIAILAVILAFSHGAIGLTAADSAALEQFTKDYVSWSYCGRPVEFRERLDYKSFEEQRMVLLKLAEIQWNGVWGDYWRRNGVKDIQALRKLSPKESWIHFHDVVKPAGTDKQESAISVDIHAITEARG